MVVSMLTVAAPVMVEQENSKIVIVNLLVRGSRPAPIRPRSPEMMPPSGDFKDANQRPPHPLHSQQPVGASGCTAQPAGLSGDGDCAACAPFLQMLVACTVRSELWCTFACLSSCVYRVMACRERSRRAITLCCAPIFMIVSPVRERVVTQGGGW